MWRLAARYASLGIEMAIAIALGTLGGQWLDGHFGTQPWLFWLGLAAGIGAAIKAIHRVIKTTNLNRL